MEQDLDPRPREAPTPSVRTSSSAATPVPSISDISLLSPEPVESDTEVTQDDLRITSDHSIIPIKQKIEKIREEKFDAEAKIKSSKVLTKTIRTIGVQQLNIDIEKQAYKELCPLDVDKENVIQEEIGARLARVEKIEMARPIKSSYGQPKITDFDHLIKIHTSSLTFKNLAHKTPTLQTTQARFDHIGPDQLRESMIASEPDFFSV